jgi:hypothetical protein
MFGSFRFLLALLTTDAVLAPHVVRGIAVLVRDVTPVQLSWLDGQVRHSSYAHYWPGGFHQLQPGAVSRLARRFHSWHFVRTTG